MSKLTQNITDLQSVLDKVNALPEAGTELPELTNPATASELFADKELIDADGNVVKGTFSIDEELTTQDDLIAQIQTALEGKAGGSSSDNVSAEWQDVFALPTTYIPTHAGLMYYYIEIPDNLKAVSLRCSSGSEYYGASTIIMNDGSTISFTSNAATFCSISILNEENVIKIGVDSSYCTTAEYLIV